MMRNLLACAIMQSSRILPPTLAYLFGLLFDPEDGGSMFLQNVRFHVAKVSFCHFEATRSYISDLYWEDIFQDIRLQKIRLHSQKLQQGWRYKSQFALVLD
jgi:hypothetical protein